MEIWDIMWDTMKDHYKKMVERICRDYETNSKYKLFKIFEDGQLKGFYCYYDTDNYRMLEAGYYVGKDRFMALKMFNKMRQGANVLRACVQKPNERMWQAYIRRGFKIIGEDMNNYILEWKVD